MSQNLFGEIIRAENDEVVYLLQYSDEPIYKIGYTANLNRRLREVNALIPYQAHFVHQIYTDSARWLEKYWHRHFDTKRRPGAGIKRLSEWFNLSEAEVEEFKSHKEMNKPVGNQLTIDYDALEIEQERQLQIREAAILRVIEHYDALSHKHPGLAVRLANSCNFQISKFDEKVARMQDKSFSQEQAIKKWERESYLAADAKIRI